MLNFQRLASLLFVSVVACPGVYGVPVQIGNLVYETTLSGNHVFRILNLTGDPALGGLASPLPGIGDPPPDFPVYTPVTFQNASVTAVVQDLLDLMAAPQPITFPPVDFLPGVYDSNDPGVYAFDAREFDPLLEGLTLIELSFTVDPQLLTLYDGTVWTVDIGNLPLQVILSPGFTYLQPGDLIPIFVDLTQAVPEPGSVTLGLLGVLAIGWRVKSRRLRV